MIRRAIRDRSFRGNFSSTRERIIAAIAWRLPRSLAYWSTIRVGVHATTGEHSTQVVPELHFMDALKRWDDR